MSPKTLLYSSHGQYFQLHILPPFTGIHTIFHTPWITSIFLNPLSHFILLHLVFPFVFLLIKDFEEGLLLLGSHFWSTIYVCAPLLRMLCILLTEYCNCWFIYSFSLLDCDLLEDRAVVIHKQMVNKCVD